MDFTFKSGHDLDVQISNTERFNVTILEDPNYVIGALGEASVLIADDDGPPKPQVSVTAITPAIPENGLDSGTFQFKRYGPTMSALTVSYSVGGTATPGTDYSSLVGVAVIPAGSESVTIQFQAIDDKDVEPDETVSVTITPNATYTIGTASDSITILDDDRLTVTVYPTGNASEPATPGQFTFKRDGDLSANLVVNYTVSGSATSGSDYQPLSGSITIPAGSPSASVPVIPIDDSVVEGDESITVTLTNNAAYDIGTPGVATILLRDNEFPSVNVIATDDTASEPGDDIGTIRISRGSVVNGVLAVNLLISGTAIPGADYVPLDNPVIIPDGQSSVSVDIVVFDDLHLEPTETVIVGIAPGTNYISTTGMATVKILDDDPFSVPAVGFTFASSSAPESQSPGISLSLSQTSMAPVTVNYRVIGGTAAQSDYTLPPPPFTFNPGEKAKSMPLQINNNALAQPNRTIRLALFDPTNATLDGIKIHTYTILDDDSSSISVTATTATASETGPVPGNFRITRIGPTNAPQVVNFQVTGTASAPGDYAPLGTTVTIPAGAAFMDLPVTPVNDPSVELSQTVVLTLLTAPGAKIGAPNAATVTIVDDDSNSSPVITLTASHPFAYEGGASGEFTFTRSGPATNALTVFFTVGGTATSGINYVALPNSITIPSGQSSVVLPVTTVENNAIEGDKTVQLTLTVQGTYRATHPASATVTIIDNDQNVRIDASDFTASEPGTDTGAFTFTRTGTTNGDLQVFYTISGTASNGVDYVGIASSFVIPGGSYTGHTSNHSAG